MKYSVHQYGQFSFNLHREVNTKVEENFARYMCFHTYMVVCVNLSNLCSVGHSRLEPINMDVLHLSSIFYRI